MSEGQEKKKERQRWGWLRQMHWLFFAAFVMRVAVGGVYLSGHHQFSWKSSEPAGIAEALVQGRGFASAFHDANWPTAWLAPVYPALLACIFRIFGVDSMASALVIILFNVIFASATAVVLVRLGREQFSETAGMVAGWAWALAPPLLIMPLFRWETCLSGLVMAFGLMVTLRLGAHSRARDWAACGAIWSFAGWLNPALLASLPAVAAWRALRIRRWKGPALMILVCLVGILPWTVRNFQVLGVIVPVRSNFWPEVYFGNVSFSVHPTGDSMLYQREGEIGFEKDLKARVIAFVRSNPREFARLTRGRMVAFWMQPAQQQPYPLLLFLLALGGVFLAWRRGKRGAEFAFVLLFYPLIYYISYTFSRYRYPIEPVMYALAGFAISEAVREIQRRRALVAGSPAKARV